MRALSARWVRVLGARGLRVGCAVAKIYNMLWFARRTCALGARSILAANLTKNQAIAVHDVAHPRVRIAVNKQRRVI